MQLVQQLKSEISKIIVGKDKEIELLTLSLLFNGHILLESVPGTGKTQLAKTFADCINGSFSRIQFTPDVLPSDVTGIQFFNPKKQEFELRTGPIIANVVLADEINRATPRTQSSLLEVMEERQVTIDGITVQVEDPFLVIATQNPVESQQGTFQLPIAQMDRFFMKITMEYPTLEEEKAILQKGRMAEKTQRPQPVLNKDQILTLKKQVKQVKLNEVTEDYMLEIVRKTREHVEIELGVSPRGAIALMRASQGHAYLNKREYVVPEDIKTMIPYVLGHRIVLSTEASLTKTADELLQEIIDSVPLPVEMSPYS